EIVRLLPSGQAGLPMQDCAPGFQHMKVRHQDSLRFQGGEWFLRNLDRAWGNIWDRGRRKEKVPWLRKR
ncbi:hypothetical protein ACQP3C_28415, partial [Escherichia coli]